MLITSITASKRFIVTENKDKADAILKATGSEASSKDLHASSETTVAGRGAIAESEAHTQTVREARLVVRLVSPDDDVIWTATKESKGAKYKGAGADVADQVVKQLLSDVEKLEPKPK